MMKLILFITALLALVCSNKALECYECRTPDYQSSIQRFNSLPVCDKDIEKSHKTTLPSLDFPVCLKLKEKVKVSDKDDTLIIRTSETRTTELKLNETIFIEKNKCDTDLCNTGSFPAPAWLTLLLSLPLAISLNI